MRRSISLILLFVLLAILMTTLLTPRTSFKRRELIASFSSDSDTVWVTRRADNWQDSIFDIGGSEQGTQLELWFCLYGDSGRITFTWYYGHNPSNLFGPETLVDTALADGDTIHTVYTVTNWKYAFGSAQLADSLRPTAGDSSRVSVTAYTQ